MNGRKSFSKNVKRLLFDELEIILDKDPKIWRKDEGGKVICFPSYGDENSYYGWNIHHINEKPHDNRISNLIAISFETHQCLHER